MTLPATRPVTAVADADRDRRRRLEQLFAAHGSTVYAYARRRGSAADADDVVSDTFLVAWRRLDDLPDAALPWLLKVARNALANRRRSGARQEALRVKLAVTDRPAALVPVGSADAVTDRVTRALETLPRAEYDALTLLAWEGLSPEEVGTVLGCSRAAVYLRISRARRRLRRALDDALEPEGPRDDDH